MRKTETSPVGRSDLKIVRKLVINDAVVDEMMAQVVIQGVKNGKWASILTVGSPEILNRLVKNGVHKGQITILDAGGPVSFELTKAGFTVNNLSIQQYKVAKRFDYVFLPSTKDAELFASYLTKGGEMACFGDTVFSKDFLLDYTVTEVKLMSGEKLNLIKRK